MPLHLLVAYFVADHAFVNNYKLRELTKTGWIKHLIWVFLVFLAFTFDRSLGNAFGLLLLFGAFAWEIVLRFLREKFGNDLSEVLSIGFYIMLSFLSADLLKTSYITPEFSWYLMGMLVVTVGVTYFLRKGIIDRNATDTVGISERLVIFIFTFAGHYEWVAITILLGLVYRLIFSKEKKMEWFISPAMGIIISIVWKIIMLGVF